jgi:hypothetical protein
MAFGGLRARPGDADEPSGEPELDCGGRYGELGRVHDCEPLHLRSEPRHAGIRGDFLPRAERDDSKLHAAQPVDGGLYDHLQRHGCIRVDGLLYRADGAGDGGQRTIEHGRPFGDSG